MGDTTIAAAAVVATFIFCVAALAAVVEALIIYVEALGAAKFESLYITLIQSALDAST